MSRSRWVGPWMASVLVLTACGGRGDADAPADQPAAASGDSSAAGGMAGMPGMQDTTADPMAAHLERMAAMSADSLKVVLPEHRQQVANLLAQMNRDMAAMSMSGDAAWTATVDSVRNDLTRMPDMTGKELRALMQGHRDRVARLMAMHKSMMGKM